MKKLLSALTLLSFIGAPAMAQTTVRIAPEIGATFVTMSQKYDGVKRQTNYQPGWRAGGVVDIDFTKHFTLQPGIFFTGNNGTESNYAKHFYTGGHVPASYTDQRRYHINYLQIPLYGLYRTGNERFSRFFIGGGPYFGLGVGGRFQQNYTSTLNGQNIVKRYDSPMSLGYTDADQIGTLDFGLQATAGFETNYGLYFRLFYGYGIANSSPLQNDANVYHQSGGGITIGFYFHLDGQPAYLRRHY